MTERQMQHQVKVVVTVSQWSNSHQGGVTGHTPRYTDLAQGWICYPIMSDVSLKLRPGILSAQLGVIKRELAMFFPNHRQLEKLPPYERLFSLSCVGLQPSAATVGPFGHNNWDLRAQPKMLKMHLENFAEIYFKFFAQICFPEKNVKDIFIHKSVHDFFWGDMFIGEFF